MSRKVRVFKFFLAHQDEQQENWLRSMSQQGLHLVNVNPFCIWTFRCGEPADIVYRLDFPFRQEPAFLQLMEDAGWKLAATTVGWHYWCTPSVDGKAPGLFTDGASKARKFKLVVAIVMLSMLSMLPMLYLILTEGVRTIPAVLTIPVVMVFALWVLLVPYATVRLLLRIRNLRSPLPS